MITALFRPLLNLLVTLFEGGYTSGAESCQYLRRLAAAAASSEDRAKAA